MKDIILKLKTGEEVLGYTENTYCDPITLHDAMMVKSYMADNGYPLVRLVKYSVFGDGYDVEFPLDMIYQIFDMNKEMAQYYTSSVKNSKKILEKEALESTENNRKNKFTEEEMKYILENYSPKLMN